MKRPDLSKMDLQEAMAGIMEGRAGLLVTMSAGQWDGLLQSAYDAGATLLELNGHEEPVAAYRRRVQ
ncbi:MAG: hypothetical protein ACYDH8_14405 [Syntrophales bacterium]